MLRDRQIVLPSVARATGGVVLRFLPARPVFGGEIAEMDSSTGGDTLYGIDACPDLPSNVRDIVLMMVRVTTSSRLDRFASPASASPILS
jgi:hypothetical protein